MSAILDKENAILGIAIVRHQETGHVEVFSDVSGVTITGTSGNIDFKDQYLSGYVNLSESGVAALEPVNGYTSIIGVLNQVGKIYISPDDTTAEELETKLLSTSGITLTVINNGGNEKLEIGVSASVLANVLEPYLDHNGLGGIQGGVSGEYYHLTAQELIDLTSGLSADNQHYHNASAILADDTNWDLVSGANVQEALDTIDELLKIRNTMLVNFDLSGSVRNGNTSLGIQGDMGYIQYDNSKTGIAVFSARVPENYIVGTALTLTIKWFSVGADTNNVRWVVNYKGSSVGDSVNAASTSVVQVVAEPGVASQIVETTFAISSSAFVLTDVMTFSVQRIGADVTDTSDENSRIVEVSLDY